MKVRHIVLESIKNNPRAGQTTFPVAGRQETIVEENGTIVSRRDVTFLRSMTPSPQYLFEYEPMNVRCGYCNAEFPIEDLKEDSIWDDGGDTPICDICPKCNEADCVREEIKYETIEEALERKEKV